MEQRARQARTGLRVLGPLDPDYELDGGPEVVLGRDTGAGRACQGKGSCTDPAALDRPLQSAATGRRFTIRALLAALREAGAMPGGDADADAQLAGGLFKGVRVEDSRRAPEAAVPPQAALGLAHGAFARTVPASPEGLSACVARYRTECPTAFQALTRGAVGDQLQMTADVGRMGAGRIRRVEQSELYWANVYPYDELIGSMHNWGRMVLPPDAIAAGVRDHPRGVQRGRGDRQRRPGRGGVPVATGEGHAAEGRWTGRGRGSTTRWNRRSRAVPTTKGSW